MRKSAFVVLQAAVVLALAAGRAGAAASDNACDELKDHLIDKFRCCSADPAQACDGQKNAYSNAGCGDPNLLCRPAPGTLIHATSVSEMTITPLSPCNPLAGMLIFLEGALVQACPTPRPIFPSGRYFSWACLPDPDHPGDGVWRPFGGTGFPTDGLPRWLSLTGGINPAYTGFQAILTYAGTPDLHTGPTTLTTANFVATMSGPHWLDTSGTLWQVGTPCFVPNP